MNVSSTGLESILRLGANVNVYMAHGGTNFGFEAGANTGPFKAGILVRTTYHSAVQGMPLHR